MTEKEILESDNTDIVQDEKFLRKPCKKVTLEEGKEIAAKLFRVMSDRGHGYGLAANQIGIQKQVCVVNVKQPYYFVNPRIVEAEGEVYYFENCLSFPNQVVRTKRFSTIVIEADNHDSKLYFSVDHLPMEQKSMYNLDVTEIVALQHEISHLEGKTMFDYEYEQEPIKVTERYGRNDKVTITDGTDMITIKYKNFNSYEKRGYKII